MTGSCKAYLISKFFIEVLHFLNHFFIVQKVVVGQLLERGLVDQVRVALIDIQSMLVVSMSLCTFEASLTQCKLALRLEVVPLRATFFWS